MCNCKLIYTVGTMAYEVATYNTCDDVVEAHASTAIYRYNNNNNNNIYKTLVQKQLNVTPYKLVNVFVKACVLIS